MSFDYARFERLKRFTDSIGSVYGTEDFSVYLYSLVKMTKPKSVLELGTGFGSTALWIALALEENQLGTLHTVDDGSEWESLKSAHHLLSGYYNESYPNYISNLIRQFKLQDRIQFHNERVTSFDYSASYDIVFSDFSHSPFFVVKLLTDILSRMSENSFIFIDSASTYYPSYQTLESLIGYLNEGRMPKTMRDLIDTKEHHDSLYNKILSSKFELTHIIENKQRNQNSTAQIKIVPCDIMPQPRVNIRF